MKKSEISILDIGILGLTGRMGQSLVQQIEKDSSLSLIGGHWTPKEDSFAELSFFSLNDLCVESKVVIDFSSPAITSSLLDVAKSHKTPLVIGTTGLDEQQKEQMDEISRSIPIFYAPNFSIGFYLFHKAAKEVASHFPSDIDIIETHHRHKKDAPSGTALFLAHSLNRKSSLHSIRACNVIGSHEIRFQGEKEKIFFTHEVKERSTFAMGALTAAKFIHNKPAKLYSMEDLLCSQTE